MPTIIDVAREAGVSSATVSRVVNNSPKVTPKTVELVTTVMKRLGYRPNAAARTLVSQHSNTIGIVVGDVSDPFFGSLLKSIDKVARESNKHTLIGNGFYNADDERRALDLLINNRCDAIIVHSKGLSDEELINYSEEIKGLVVINRYVPEIASRCIALDNIAGAYLVTKYLISQGHSQIACIKSSKQIDDTSDRVAGYLQALEEAGITLSSHYIEAGDANSEGGETAMTNLLSKSLDITAVVAYNDYMAVGAMRALKANGISIPQDVSVVGFDDGIIAAYVEPALTTARYPISVMAEQAARMALALSSDDQIGQEPIIFKPTLVHRNSVKPR